MVTVPLPTGLAAWREAPRVRALNGHGLNVDGRYVLCWLQQALRACDNPVIDAAVRLGNALGLPVLVYHGVREEYPYASDRLHHFILGASRDLAADCRTRGLACVQHVDRAERREKGLVYRLGGNAAAVVLEDQPTFVARWQAERVATRIAVPVYAVNAACLVPPSVLGDGIVGRTAFLRRHEPARAAWIEADDRLHGTVRGSCPLLFHAADPQPCAAGIDRLRTNVLRLRRCLYHGIDRSYADCDRSTSPRAGPHLRTQ